MTVETVRGRRRWWVAGAGLTVAILVLTHLPQGVVPADLPAGGWDKVAHAFVYAVIGYLYLVALGGRSHTLGKAMGVGLLVLGIGALDEVSQPWVGRTCAFGDWLADGAGVSLAGLAWQLWHRGRFMGGAGSSKRNAGEREEQATGTLAARHQAQ